LEIFAEGIRILWDFLRIGLAGLEIFCRRDPHSLGFPENWISGLRDICGGDLHFLGFPEDWIIRQQA